MAAGTAAIADERRVCDQLGRVASKPTVRRLCGEPYLNNYVIVLPPAGMDAESCATEVGTATTGLNTADQLLLDWCEQLISSNSLRDAGDMCGEWRTHVESGENLVGATFAVHVFHQLARSLPLASLLVSERPDIVRVLQNIDPSARDVCRLNGYVPLRVLEPVIELLLGELDRSGALAGISRIEVAQDLGPELSGPAAAAPTFPTLMLYVHSDAAPHLVRHAVDIFAGLTTPLARPGVPGAQFAVPLGPAATFSQGFRLFKHYLYPLGMLDSVYDAQWQYGLTAVPAVPPVANGVALRRLLSEKHRQDTAPS